MILYHGSNTDIKEINLAMCRPYKDFGRGFYLTEMKEQAEKWLLGLPVYMVVLRF